MRYVRAGLMAAILAVLVGQSDAAEPTLTLVTEEFMVDLGDPGIQLYVRNKHPKMGLLRSLPQWQTTVSEGDRRVSRLGDGETKQWEDAMSFRAALDEITEKFVTDFNNGNAAGCAAGYTEDAISYWTTSHVLRGRKEIEQHYVDLLAGGAKLTSLETVHAEGSENLGYAIQTYVGNQGAGMVMLAMRRSADGKWAVSAEAITAS